MPVTPLLTPPDVARQLSVSTETVREWLRAGTLPGVRLGAGPRGSWRIRQSDVDALLAAGPPTEPVADERQAELDLHTDTTLGQILA